MNTQEQIDEEHRHAWTIANRVGIPPGYQQHPLEGGRYIFVILAPDGSEVPGTGDKADLEVSYALAWAHYEASREQVAKIAELQGL